MSTREIGAQGEAAALKYLKKQGYKILKANFATEFGEIDFIAKDGKDIVFIEVKLRTSDAFGMPAEAVGRRKQSKIIKSALSYMKLSGLCGSNMRFDVLSLGPDPGRIELIRNAFISDGRYTV